MLPAPPDFWLPQTNSFANVYNCCYSVIWLAKYMCVCIYTISNIYIPSSFNFLCLWLLLSSPTSACSESYLDLFLSEIFSVLLLSTFLFFLSYKLSILNLFFAYPPDQNLLFFLISQVWPVFMTSIVYSSTIWIF